MNGRRSIAQRRVAYRRTRVRLASLACLAWAWAYACAASPAAAPSATTSPSMDPNGLEPISTMGDPSFRHDAAVTKGMVLSDGRRLLTSGNDGTVRLWDLKTGRQLQCLRHDADYVWDFLPLPGEEKLLTTGGEAKVILWDLASGLRLAEYPHGKMTFRVALDAGATRLAAGDEGGNCVVWNLADKSEAARFHPGTEALYTVLFSADGSNVLAGSSDSTILSWAIDPNAGGEKTLKPKDRKQKWTALLGGAPDTGDIFTMTPSSDRKRVLVCCGQRGPWMMDPNSGRELWRTKDPQAARCGAWSPDGNRVAVLSDSCLAVLIAADGAKCWSLALAKSTRYGVAWSADGSEILCGSQHLLARFAAGGAQAGQRVYPPPGAPIQDSPVTRAIPSPDGRLIYECGSSRGIRVWDRATKTVKATWMPEGEVTGMDLSADGMTLIGSEANSVVAFDTRTGKEIRRWGHGLEHGMALTLTPDGRMFVMSSLGGLTVWGIAGGEEVLELPDVSMSYSSDALAIGPDLELAVVSGDGQVRVLKLPSGELLQELPKTEGLQGCAFLPGSSQRLMTWGDKRMQLWAPGESEGNVLSETELAKLVEQLGSASFQEREAATKRLIAAGSAVLPLLRKIDSKDAEQKARLALVQKEVLSKNSLQVASSLDLKEGHTASFAMHPDGRHWAIAFGNPPHREVLIGVIAGRELKELGTLKCASAPQCVAFDSRGVLVTGNCNGTITEYALQPPSAKRSPTSAPADKATEQ